MPDEIVKPDGDPFAKMREGALAAIEKTGPGSSGQWYANVNDLIGGHCVGTIKGKPSGGKNADNASDMCSKETALHIANSDPSNMLDMIRIVELYHTAMMAASRALANVEVNEILNECSAKVGALTERLAELLNKVKENTS